MAPQLIQSALSVSPSWEGVRCYPKTSDGLVRELCLNISPLELQQAMRARNFYIIGQSDKWFLGELVFQAHPQSRLVSLIDSGLRKSVFYQDTVGVVRERRHGENGTFSHWTWHPTALEQDGALPGTSLAAVQTHDGENAALFYQAPDGSIVLRSAEGEERTWNKKSRRIGRAPKGRKHTGIAALASEDLFDITLFYQDSAGLLYECTTSLDGKSKKCKPVSSTKYERVLHSITAITLADGETRLYIQDDSMSIIEWIRPPDGDSWARGDLVIPAPSDANIVAFTQSSAAGDCLQVYWSHADHVVRQRVWFEGKWMDERGVYVNWSAKDLAGFWTGRALDFPVSERPDPHVVLGSREHEDEAFEGVSAFPIYAPLIPPSGGLVVIRVQDHTFKVKSAVLSESSALFHDMFSIPRPAENHPQEDLYEGCPIVPLQDNSSDVELLLQVLHDGYALKSYGIREYTVLLDLGSKYQTWGLVKRLLSVLSHEYPDTLRGLHHLSQNHPACSVQMHACPLTDYYSRLGDSPDESSFTDIRAMLRLLAVATRAGADVLVPSIAVLCCLHDPEAIRAAGAATDTDPAQISAILNLQTSLTGYARTRIWGAAGPGSMRCATPNRCDIAALDAVRVLLFPWWIAALDRRSSGLCAATACVSNFWETRAAGCGIEEMVWEAIPKRLELGTWQQLRDRATEMFGDSGEFGV